MKLYHLHHANAEDGYPADFVVAAENEDTARIMAIRDLVSNRSFSCDNGIWADHHRTTANVIGESTDDLPGVIVPCPIS
jgi:hypothetical protein